MTPLPPCPLPQGDERVCGCRNRPAGTGGLVSIVSSDAAVRRALVLLLEAEGMPARAFCVLPAFLSVAGGMAGALRHCLIIEEQQAREVDMAALAGKVAREGQPVSLIVLASPPHGRRPPFSPLAGVEYVDPFKVDEVLRAARQALALEKA